MKQRPLYLPNRFNNVDAPLDPQVRTWTPLDREIAHRYLTELIALLDDESFKHEKENDDDQ